MRQLPSASGPSRMYPLRLRPLPLPQNFFTVSQLLGKSRGSPFAVSSHYASKCNETKSVLPPEAFVDFIPLYRPCRSSVKVYSQSRRFLAVKRLSKMKPHYSTVNDKKLPIISPVFCTFTRPNLSQGSASWPALFHPWTPSESQKTRPDEWNWGSPHTRKKSNCVCPSKWLV